MLQWCFSCLNNKPWTLDYTYPTNPTIHLKLSVTSISLKSFRNVFPYFPHVFSHFPYDFPYDYKINLPLVYGQFMDPIDYSCKHHKLVGDLEHFLFSNILRMIIPTDELIFFRGVGQPPTSIYTYILYIYIYIYHIYHFHQHNYGKSPLLMGKSPLFVFINWGLCPQPLWISGESLGISTTHHRWPKCCWTSVPIPTMPTVPGQRWKFAMKLSNVEKICGKLWGKSGYNHRILTFTSSNVTLK